MKLQKVLPNFWESDDPEELAQIDRIRPLLLESDEARNARIDKVFELDKKLKKENKSDGIRRT